MKIVVFGGTGFIGSQLVEGLRRAGHDAMAASPASGVNTLTGEGVREVLIGANVVVDVTNSPSFDATAAAEFFRKSTQNLAAAEASANVAHHIVLSVVGTDRLQSSGYFRGKLAQERLIAASAIPFTVMRCTQFYEFMGKLADVYRDGEAIRLPEAMVQPIAAIDAVEMLLELALSPALNRIVEVAGPEQFGLGNIIRRVLSERNEARDVVTDPALRYFGAELREDSLLPGRDARIGNITFDEWSRTQLRR